MITHDNSFVSALLSGAGSAHRMAVALNAGRRRVLRLAGVKPRALPRPVVSIGNIVVGGAGKTPLVEALAREWLRLGGRPALLSRGYRGGDESQLLARRLPGVPHGVGRDRHRAGLELLGRHPEIDLFLLDDGFQHQKLHRDLDVVVLDATRPFGNERFFPAGHLRESWRALARAGHFVITRAEAVAPQKLAILASFLTENHPGVPIGFAELEWEGVRDARRQVIELDLAKPWAACAAIGNPAAFFRSLERRGARLAGTRAYRDHHPFGEAELDELRAWARAIGAQGIICTEKDGVKFERLASFASGDPPLLQLRIRYRLRGSNPLVGFAVRGSR